MSSEEVNQTMIRPQQYVQPQQQAVVGTLQITDMLNSIMPLVTMMMLMMMVMPMMKSMGEAFKA